MKQMPLFSSPSTTLSPAAMWWSLPFWSNFTKHNTILMIIGFVRYVQYTHSLPREDYIAAQSTAALFIKPKHTTEPRADLIDQTTDRTTLCRGHACFTYGMPSSVTGLKIMLIPQRERNTPLRICSSQSDCFGWWKSLWSKSIKTKPPRHSSDGQWHAFASWSLLLEAWSWAWEQLVRYGYGLLIK